MQRSEEGHYNDRAKAPSGKQLGVGGATKKVGRKNNEQGEMSRLPHSL